MSPTNDEFDYNFTHSAKKRETRDKFTDNHSSVEKTRTGAISTSKKYASTISKETDQYERTTITKFNLSSTINFVSRQSPMTANTI